jgi:hypothetical protein
MPEVDEKVLFEIKFPSRHVEVNFSWEESMDSLHREGFRHSFRMQFGSCFLERWDHPDGRYRLVAYKGGGLYMSEDVNDPHWKEIIDVIIDDREPPIPLVSENWFELEIFEDRKDSEFSHMVRRLSPDGIPTTSAEWQKLALGWATKEHNRTISLRNGRSGETIFSDTFRRNRDGSVRKVAQKKPKSSS